MTNYTTDTAVIAKLGTTPAERGGMTANQFKAKFDEALTAFVTWFNSAHKTEFEAVVTSDSGKVNKSGDTMTGGLTVRSGGGITIQDPTDTNKKIITYYNNVADEYGISVSQAGVAFKPLTLSCSNLVFSVNGTNKVNMFGAGTALPATTGTMTATMDSQIKTITPTGACTFNASGGVSGQRCTFVITASGVTSYTLTWGTNFKTTGPLATGTTSGKVFVIEFIYDGTTWNEVARTVAM